MDTFVTPLCCKVFCSFYVWEIFFFQNTLLLDCVARISIIKTVQIIMVLHVCIILGFNNTSSHFFFQRGEGGKREENSCVEYKKRREKKKKRDSPKTLTNKKVVFLVPS